MVITTLTMSVLVGFTALAVDVSIWMRQANSAQGAADFAALSAAVAAEAGTNAANEGRSIAAANGFVNGQNNVAVIVNNPPATGNYTSNANAYEVVITQPQTLFFGGALGAAPTVKGRAVAMPSSTCHSDAGGNDTGGPSGTNFVLSNNETVTLPDMNGQIMHVSGYGTVQFSHDANGATLVIDSSCISVTSLGHDFNGSTFIDNYTPPNMNYVSVAHNCNGCTFIGGSMGAGGVFVIGHDANGSSFTFNACANCSANGNGALALVE